MCVGGQTRGKFPSGVRLVVLQLHLLSQHVPFKDVPLHICVYQMCEGCEGTSLEGGKFTVCLDDSHHSDTLHFL